MSKNNSLYQDATGRWGLVEGDALRVLAKLPENSIDCIVTDPPYGLKSIVSTLLLFRRSSAPQLA